MMAAGSAPLLVVAVAFCATLVSCDDETFPAHEGGGVVTSEGCDGVGEVFANNCLACHSAAGAAGGLDLETDWYTAVIDGGLVVAGDAAGSTLYQRMTSSSSPMPPSGLLGSDTLAIVEAWINDGATCDGTGGTDTTDGTDGTDGSDGTDGTDGSDGGTADGEALYMAKCAACHGASGSGGYSPSLVEEVPGKTLADLVEIIQDGQGSMPPQYPDAAEAQAVAQYCLDTFGG
jgi:mono/diheme cytochrome c family protein